MTPMNHSTCLNTKNRNLIIDFIEKEIRSIDSFLLQNENQNNNYNILAYSKAVCLASDDCSLLLN